MRTSAIILLFALIMWSSFTSAQEKADAWKQYVFAEDGFAITVPQDPKPHPDSTLPDMTAYTVSLGRGRITLRVSHQNRDCTSTLRELKEGASAGKGNINPASVTDVFVDGNPGIEYRYTLNSSYLVSDRFYCVNGKFYSFSTAWQSNQPFPKDATRIISSFHLLKTKATK